MGLLTLVATQTARRLISELAAGIGHRSCIYERSSGWEANMFRHVNVVGTITIPLPKKELVELLWDIKRIPEFDLKADYVDVRPETETTGFYAVRGRFAGISWSRDFQYFLNDDGFFLREAHPSGPEPAIQGGFMVQAVGPNESTVIHYEQYWFARRLVPLRPLIVPYLNWSVRKELQKIKRAALKKHAGGALVLAHESQ